MKKRTKKSIENKNGITLIALVITIIVLLILAGVTIVTLTGDNGLITKANEAKTATEKSALREEIDLLLLQARMGESLEKLFESATVVKNDGSAVYEVKNYKGEDFLVSSDYKYIEKVEPAYEGEWTFNENTQTLTAYNGDLTTKRGNQEIGELIIPNYYNGIRVKTIAWHFFRGGKSGLEKLTISEGLETIGGYAFQNCNTIKGNLNIPDSVVYIGDASFDGCSSMDGRLTLSKNLKTIGNAAFRDDNKLKGDVLLADSLVNLGTNVFQNCSSLDGKLRISNNISVIGEYSFLNCSNLKGDLIIPDNITMIKQCAFCGCSSLDGKLYLGKNIEKILSDAFRECSNLKGDLILYNKMTISGVRAFTNCNLIESIKFLNENTEINSAPPNAVIYGYANSTAQAYAEANKKTFKSIT